MPNKLLATAAVLALIIYGVFRSPEWIAPHVPIAWEKPLGDAMIGDFANRHAVAPRHHTAGQQRNNCQA